MTDLIYQLNDLPHRDRRYRSHFLSHQVTVYWHWPNQSQCWPYNAKRLAGQLLECQTVSHWYDSTPENSRHQRDSNPRTSALEADALTTRLTRRWLDEGKQNSTQCLPHWGGSLTTIPPGHPWCHRTSQPTVKLSGTPSGQSIKSLARYVSVILMPQCLNLLRLRLLSLLSLLRRRPRGRSRNQTRSLPLSRRTPYHKAVHYGQVWNSNSTVFHDLCLK